MPSGKPPRPTNHFSMEFCFISIIGLKIKYEHNRLVLILTLVQLQKESDAEEDDVSPGEKVQESKRAVLFPLQLQACPFCAPAQQTACQRGRFSVCPINQHLL